MQSLQFETVTGQELTLTSSLQQSGRTHACPGESVIYTCKTTASLLIWTAQPYFQSFIFHSFDSPHLVATIPEAIRVLNATSPNFLSQLILNPGSDVENITVVCRTINDVHVSESLLYRKAGIVLY